MVKERTQEDAKRPQVWCSQCVRLMALSLCSRLLSSLIPGFRCVWAGEQPAPHEHRYFILDFLGLGFASGRSVRSHRAREVHHIEFAC
jgi:hypothetical protein